MKKYWTTQKGEKIEYRKLEDGHLLNILKYIERRAEEGMDVSSYDGEGFLDPDEGPGFGDLYTIFGDEVKEELDYDGLLREAKRRKLKINP